MLDKLKNKFFGEIILPKLVNRAIRHGLTALGSFLASVYFTTKIDPILKQYGVNLNPVEVIAGLTTLLGSLSGSLIHYVQHQILKIN